METIEDSIEVASKNGEAQGDGTSGEVANSTRTSRSARWRIPKHTFSWNKDALDGTKRVNSPMSQTPPDSLDVAERTVAGSATSAQ